MEKNTVTFPQNFIGCCYGNKVLQHCFFPFLQKRIEFAIAMLITGQVIALLLQIRFWISN